LAGLIAFFVLLVSGKLRGGLRCGIPHGGVYAETFALWMLLFLAFSVAAGLVPVEGGRFLVTGGAMLLSLVALAWPVLRGVPWRQVRQEIGLTAGRQPALEPVLGLAGYAMTIPLLAVGVLLIIVLVALLRGGGQEGFSPDRMPAHPIVEFIARSGWWGRVQLLLLASVVAPVVEETMFRGVLYRHLREASCRLGFVASVLLSATVVSFIFAVIHPQGVLAVPALMALAFGFNLVREWRGTLVPAMVAHGINNGLLMLVFLLAMGD
jgi:membrane protease YdiL (CAAX protease family)